MIFIEVNKDLFEEFSKKQIMNQQVDLLNGLEMISWD